MHVDHQFLLQRVQPAMVGLVDGSLSTLAPIFSIALATQNPRYAFIAGLATSLGAAVSMGWILHTLPFLIPHYHAALFSAIAVVAFELLILAYLRWRFFEDTFIRALGIVTFAGIIIAAVSAALGSALGSTPN
jgi:hypothetical protein